MKNYFLLSILILTGCNTEKNWEDSLIQSVSFQKDCPYEKIKITSSFGGSWDVHPNKYVLDVCGQKIKYMYNEHNGWWIEIK